MGIATMERPTARYAPRWLAWIALLLLCAAYLQGGLVKLGDFDSAIEEMRRFGLQPAPFFAGAVFLLVAWHDLRERAARHQETAS